MPDDGDIEKVMKVQEARIFHEIGFIAGAQWQKEQMMKKAVEGTVCIIRHTPPFVSVQIPIEKWMNVDVSIGDKVWLVDTKED